MAESPAFIPEHLFFSQISIHQELTFQYAGP